MSSMQFRLAGMILVRLRILKFQKYGLRQTIADTLGIGGIFRNLRTIPVMLDFAKDMQSMPGCLVPELYEPDGCAHQCDERAWRN